MDNDIAFYDKRNIGYLLECLCEPKTNKFVLVWHSLLAILALLLIFIRALESADGPNHYDGRINRATLPFLPNAHTYWLIEVIASVPVLVDALIRVCVVFLLMTNRKEYREIRKKLIQDNFTLILMSFDILSAIPFVLSIIYIKPKKLALPEAAIIVLRLLELMVTSRVMRMANFFPTFLAVRVTLYNSGVHLVLPFFFFFTFNIWTGVIFFFLEPCYDVGSCPWPNLWYSTFYSIVTMLTVGYGNQYPQFEWGRLVACMVMLFGSIFMSMPLAIVGADKPSTSSVLAQY